MLLFISRIRRSKLDGVCASEDARSNGRALPPPEPRAYQYSSPTLSGFAITAMVRMLGIAVVTISNHLGINSSNSVDVPVTFAPGRARLATSPQIDGVAVDRHDHRNGRCGVLCRARRWDAGSHNRGRVALTKDAAKLWKLIRGRPVYVDG